MTFYMSIERKLMEENYWGIQYDYRRLYAVRDLPTDMLVEIGNMLRDGYDIEWIARGSVVK